MLLANTISHDPLGFAYVCGLFLVLCLGYAFAGLAARRHGWHVVSVCCFALCSLTSLAFLVHFVVVSLLGGM